MTINGMGALTGPSAIDRCTWRPPTVVKKAEVAGLLAASFPNYTGRRFTVQVARSVTLSDLNWSGGTRSEYRIVRLNDGQGANLSGINTPPPWDNQWEGKSFAMSPGFVLAETGYFCGKQRGVCFYFHPDDAPRMLALSAH